MDLAEPTGPAAREHAQAVLDILWGKVVVEFLADFWDFLRVWKKFWMLPMLLVLLLFGGLLVLAEGSAVAPFIYTLF